MDHVDCLAIKFRQKQQSLDRNKHKKKVKLQCAVCNSANLGQYHCVDIIQSNLLKSFVMNELSKHGEMITRKGTGIVEADHLCYKC